VYGRGRERITKRRIIITNSLGRPKRPRAMVKALDEWVVGDGREQQKQRARRTI
jgi:hypothetical protein